LTSALDEGDWSSSRLGCFTPRDEAPVPTGYEACDKIRDEREIWKHKGRDDVVLTAEVTQRRMRWKDDHE